MEKYNKKDMETQMCIDGWINKMWYKYTMEYYSDLKNKIGSCATTWMNLEGNKSN